MEFVVTLTDLINVGVCIAFAMIAASFFYIQKTIFISVGFRRNSNTAMDYVVVSQTGRFTGNAADTIDIAELKGFINEAQGLIDPEICQIRILQTKYSIHLRKDL